MGCDIHAVFQRKTGLGEWEDVGSTWDQDRHYFLFSWLADVRNGFGFAGVPTYTPIQAIAQPRGLPSDFLVTDDGFHPCTLESLAPHRLQWLNDEEKKNPQIWMGDHSHSWLTADEILAAPKPLIVWETGIVNREFFDKWDGHTPPKEYSGGISGPKISVAESPVDVTSVSTHVRIYWKTTDDPLAYFTDEVKRLKNEHGEVRVVFGFDS